MSDERGDEDAVSATPPHGDKLRPAVPTEVPSTGAEEPGRASYADPLPGRSHALDPSVSDTEESREQAPPTPGWLLDGRGEGREGDK